MVSGDAQSIMVVRALKMGFYEGAKQSGKSKYAKGIKLPSGMWSSAFVCTSAIDWGLMKSGGMALAV